jgi:hypothetical protein
VGVIVLMAIALWRGLREDHEAEKRASARRAGACASLSTTRPPTP